MESCFSNLKIHCGEVESVRGESSEMTEKYGIEKRWEGDWQVVSVYVFCLGLSLGKKLISDSLLD